jgi:hypothetical protein
MIGRDGRVSECLSTRTAIWKFVQARYQITQAKSQKIGLLYRLVFSMLWYKSMVSGEVAVIDLYMVEWCLIDDRRSGVQNTALGAQLVQYKGWKKADALPYRKCFFHGC